MLKFDDVKHIKMLHDTKIVRKVTKMGKINTNSVRLLAATALVAATFASAPAFADVVNTAVTAKQSTDASTAGGYDVQTGGSVIVDSDNAVEVDSATGTKNVLSTAIGTTVESTTSGTAVLAVGDIDVGTITNAGTIRAVTTAINLSSASSAGAALVNTGTITGAVTMTETDDTVTMTSGTITGAVDLGTGNDTLNITTGTIAGTIDGGVGATDAISVDGAFSTGGAISNVEGFTAASGSTFTIGHTITGGATLAINDGGSVVSNVDNTLSGAITFGGGASGSLNVANSTTLQGATMAAAGTGTTYTVNIDADSAGLLNITGSAVDLTNTTVSVVRDSSLTYQATQTYTIATGNAPATAPSANVSATASPLLTYAVAANGNDVELTVTRTGTYQGVEGVTNATSGAAAALEALGANATGELATVQNTLESATSAGAIASALETLAPSVDSGVTVSSLSTQTASLGTVSDRLASVRGGATGMAAGDGAANRAAWVQAFGSAANQGIRNGIAGYSADTVGMAFGADTDELVEGYRTGLAFSYASTDVDSKSSNNASTDIDSYQLTAYGSTEIDEYFVDGMVSVGFNDYEGTRTVSGVGTASADYDGMQYGAKVEVGRNYAELYGATITPVAGLQYSMLDIDEYTETGAGGANLKVDTETSHALIARVGAKARWNLEGPAGLSYMPELRAGLSYDLIGDEQESTANFTGGGTSFNTTGSKVAQFGVNLGASVTITEGDGFEVLASYDAEVKDDYNSHSGVLRARWEF